MSELTAVHFEGITLDNLGQYLCGIGLLSALSKNKNWSNIRGCWQNEHFVILGDKISVEAIEDYLLNNWKPTEYRKIWVSDKKDKKKADKNIWELRNSIPDEEL